MENAWYLSRLSIYMNSEYYQQYDAFISSHLSWLSIGLGPHINTRPVTRPQRMLVISHDVLSLLLVML